MHPKCCAEKDDPRCNIPRHRVAVLVTGVRERFIPMSTLHHVVDPARRSGFEVDYFADLSSDWNRVDFKDADPALYNRLVDPAIQNRSDLEIKDFVEKQALLLGARHAHVSLAPQDEIDELPDDPAWHGRFSQYSPYRNDSLGSVGRNLLRRYKSIERLWALAKQHAGTYEYTSVLVLRDDSFWTADMDTALLHASSTSEIAYSLNCGQRSGLNDKALVMSGRVADDILSLYSTWYQDPRPQLQHISNAEEFLKKVAETRYVPWEEVGGDRLPTAVASHVKASDALQPVLCIDFKDSCGVAKSTNQIHPFCQNVQTLPDSAA